MLRVDSSSNDTLYEDFEKLWDLDSIGIREKDTVHEAFEKNVSFQDGKYSVHLPNIELTIEAIKKSTECPAVGKVHYLPHHGVVRRDALTTNLRIVFDASSRATSEDPSLNDCLYSGPALTPTIFKILLWFRERKIALVGDIEKAFLNIKVQEQDRNVLRFLWIDSLEKDDPELVLYRFCRVVFGVNSSAFLLNATLRHHISQYSLDAEFVENLLNSFYVDDLVSGERNLERCLLLYEKSKKCLSAGGFNLRKWISNSPQLLELIREDRTRTKENCPETQPVVAKPMQKLLWDIWRS